MNNDPSPRKLMFPFRLATNYMEKLLVADIKGDPEFSALEPQTFDDPINGKGMRVIRYRRDGTVDVYWQPGVRFDRSTFEIGKGTADLAETEITPARFEITDRGLDLDVRFTDLQGRVNALTIREDTRGKKSFPLLAPISSNIEHPIQFNVVYLPDIDFVRRAGTVISGRIGERAIQPGSIPLLINGRRIWLMRYADKPVIGIFNPRIEQPTLVEMNGAGQVEVDGMSLTIEADGSLARMTVGQASKQTELDFTPAFPNLLDFAEGKSARGQWILHTAGARITAGAYSAVNQGGSIAVDLDELENWKPENLPFSVWLLTTVVRMFRTWPSTYRWRGVVKTGEQPSMTGTWERKKAKSGRV